MMIRIIMYWALKLQVTLYHLYDGRIDFEIISIDDWPIDVTSYNIQI